VPEYWIVDVENRTVDRWRPDDSAAETLGETLRWHPDVEVAPLVIDLPGYFDRVTGTSA
jgi:Uma2 family endonuclease